MTGDDVEHPAVVRRVRDADPPGLTWCRLTRELHVAAAVDGMVGRAVRPEQSGGTLDGPALDQPGRVDEPAGHRVERPAGRVVRLRAQLEDVADERVRIRHPKLAATETADV